MNFRFSWKRKKHVTLSSRPSEAQCHPERPTCHPERNNVISSVVEKSHEISPCAALSRDDKSQGRDDMTIEQAQQFLNTQFNADGEYMGDNPYLSHVTVGDMLLRWQNEGIFSDEDYALLRRINIDHTATLFITRKDGGPMFQDADDEKHFVDIAAFIPQDADMSMTLMQRVAVAESMELRQDCAIVYLRLYEGTAYHCAEYLCKYYGYHLQLRYDLDKEICKYMIK